MVWLIYENKMIFFFHMPHISREAWKGFLSHPFNIPLTLICVLNVKLTFHILCQSQPVRCKPLAVTTPSSIKLHHPGHLRVSHILSKVCGMQLNNWRIKWVKGGPICVSYKSKYSKVDEILPFCCHDFDVIALLSKHRDRDSGILWFCEGQVSILTYIFLLPFT